MTDNPSFGRMLADMAKRDIVDISAKLPQTKRILRACLPHLATVVDSLPRDPPELHALSPAQGRHVIFATPRRGAVADMLSWADALKELRSEDLSDRAALWATLTRFIDKLDIDGAFMALAGRLQPEGIAQFEERLNQLDREHGGVIIAVNDRPDIQIVVRGVLVVMAGIEGRSATGVVGCLALPTLLQTDDWADDPDRVVDGRHRYWLH